MPGKNASNKIRADSDPQVRIWCYKKLIIRKWELALQIKKQNYLNSEKQ